MGQPPDPAVNADAPPAALRVRGGSPITLIVGLTGEETGPCLPEGNSSLPRRVPRGAMAGLRPASRSSSRTPRAPPAQWVEVGRCYARFALRSSALGIRNAMFDQPVEVPTLRPQFAAFVAVGKRRPDPVVRFGRGPKLPSSLRRPVAAVLL